MLFIEEDFKENWLNYSSDFKISDKSSIYLGPNGIGKTTTYKVIKEKHPLLGFFSYDDCEYHQVFHYDETYTCPLNDCSNDELVKMIDDFDGEFEGSTFEELSLEKIICLTALRVWIEKQMKDNFKGSFSGINQLFPKINHYFNHKDMWINNLDIEREDLVRKKVLLNQNDHYKSQIIPFHYALSISCDDMANELLELKQILKIPVGV